VAPRFFEYLGWKYEKSTKYENIYDKFDYRVWDQGRLLRVEVKAPKKPAGLLLFEGTGISGYEGWGRGKADLVFQFFAKDKDEGKDEGKAWALMYDRAKMLEVATNIAGPIPQSPDRYPSRSFAPVGVWQGRSGKSTRTGKPNKDCFVLLNATQARTCGYKKIEPN
jgi:hypothetical protein